MPLGPLSQPGASARLPDAPTGVSASAVSGGQASITFTPSINPGKPSGNYVATASPGPVTGSASVSPIAITGLTIGQAYTFTVVKQSGSGITSNSSSATGSITAYAPPTFAANQADLGTNTATPPSGTSTTSISDVYTTSGTLSRFIPSGGIFKNYERISGSGGTSPTTSSSLSGLAEDTNHEWRVNAENTHSTFALTTVVTPNGSTTTVSVDYGFDGVIYGGNATSNGNTSVNIGSSNSPQSTLWSLGPSVTAATIYWRARATYAGGAYVDATGTISRIPVTYPGTSTGVFRTYTTRSATGFKSVSKPSYGANITISSYTLVGGGGAGGDRTSPSFAGYGGGGGGNVQTGGSISTTTFTLSAAGAGGSKSASAAGGTSTLNHSGGTIISAAGGNAASGNYQGGSSGNGNAGFAGAFPSGGGGGGVSGAASDINGGSGNGSQGPGGPGYFNDGFGNVGEGVYIFGSAASAGAGGRSNFDGTAGSTAITWIGPA